MGCGDRDWLRWRRDRSVAAARCRAPVLPRPRSRLPQQRRIRGCAARRATGPVAAAGGDGGQPDPVPHPGTARPARRGAGPAGPVRRRGARAVRRGGQHHRRGQSGAAQPRPAARRRGDHHGSRVRGGGAGHRRTRRYPGGGARGAGRQRRGTGGGGARRAYPAYPAGRDRPDHLGNRKDLPGRRGGRRSRRRGCAGAGRRGARARLGGPGRGRSGGRLLRRQPAQVGVRAAGHRAAAGRAAVAGPDPADGGLLVAAGRVPTQRRLPGHPRLHRLARRTDRTRPAGSARRRPGTRPQRPTRRLRAAGGRRRPRRHRPAAAGRPAAHADHPVAVDAHPGPARPAGPHRAGNCTPKSRSPAGGTGSRCACAPRSTTAPTSTTASPPGSPPCSPP